MADEPRGCLLFALPARLLGGGGRPVLSAGPALPAFDAKRAHREDLPTLVRARRAAEGCQAVLGRRRASVADLVVDDVGGRIAALLGHVYDMGAELADARRFVEAHSPEQIARERTELELELVGAGAERLVELKRNMTSLERRASHVGGLESDIARLSARLGAAAAELQELEARLAGSLGSEDLLHELAAHEQAARLALEDFDRSWRELDEA